jgi:hypothetical protein
MYAIMYLIIFELARYPGPPAPSPEDVEEMSHRAVLIYRMAQVVKAKILAKKAAAGNPSQVPVTAPPPSGVSVKIINDYYWLTVESYIRLALKRRKSLSRRRRSRSWTIWRGFVESGRQLNKASRVNT